MIIPSKLPCFIWLQSTKWSTPFNILDSSLCWKETFTLESRFVALPYFSKTSQCIPQLIKFTSQTTIQEIQPYYESTEEQSTRSRLYTSRPWGYLTPQRLSQLGPKVNISLATCISRVVRRWSLEIPAIGMCFGVEKGKKGPECNCEARHEVCWWGRRRYMLFLFDECNWKLLYPQVLFDSKLTTTS